MKAMVLKETGKPFVLEDLPDPAPSPTDVVVKVLACGSGLTIHHTRMGRAPVEFPRVIGHEVAGEVVAIGGGVKQFKIGDIVTPHMYLTCGYCRWCRTGRESLCDNLAGFVGRHVDGGYAEFMKLDENSFVKVPEALDVKAHPAEAAVVCDAITTPYRVIRRARVAPGETVAVFGAGGGLGIHMLMLARWAHARTIAVEIDAAKFDACRTAGAEDVVDASAANVADALMEMTDGRGIDVAIDFVSAVSTLEAGVQVLGKGGRLVTLGGHSPDPFHVTGAILLQKELELIGSRAFSKQEIAEALDLVARGEVWPMVSETYALEQAEEAHARLEAAAITGRAALVLN